MKKILTLVILAALLTGTGCLNTFYPIFHTADIADPRQIYGEWVFENEKMVIEPAHRSEDLSGIYGKFPGRAMIIKEFSSEGIEEATNLAFLVKIGDHYFLDMFPENHPLDASLDPVYRTMFLKLHTVYRVDSFHQGKKLFIQRVSDNLIREQLEKKKIRVPLITRGDESIILAGTSELQTHIKKYANDPVFYESNSAHSYHRSK